MARTKPTPHVERPGPAEFRDPMMRDELRRAMVWMGLALVIAGVIVLAEPLMLIIGGLVFSVILDGGTRLLGRVLPIGRGWRLAIVIAARVRLHRLGILVCRHDARRPGRSASCGGRSCNSAG